MLVAGLTGNIGSGKSTVARMLKKLGARVIDTDQVARDVVRPGTPALEKITARFGPEVLNPDGTLDRTRLAQIVFTDPQAREELNAIVHPDIIEVVRETVAEYRDKGGAPLLVIEAPLLIETGLHKMVDEVWLVTVAPETQLARITARYGSEEEARRRMAAQLSQDAKISLAHRVIDNSGTPEETRQRVLQIWYETIKTPDAE